MNEPNINGANYDFDWDNSLVRLNQYMSYPCKSGYRVEQNTDWKYQADSETQVKCGDDGEFSYPATWPQCSATVTCSDPGNSVGVTRSYLSGSNLGYSSELKWVCDDKRRYIKLSMEANTALEPFKTAKCHWRKTYPLDGSDLLCVIHHCRHPHDDLGSHDPPNPNLQLNLKSRTNWDVPFNSFITYECQTGTHIERDEPSPTLDSIEVKCVENSGVYETPAQWPNCTATVLCGQPRYIY